ncbi:2-polyprenyl-3-methyl-5-hydroxy-6-metoxy-1,4-benzoquinol methylase [Salinibacter ruber]|uniref:class I SAM-dependent methyltransferase n=1 Tax=Salinibacter ruber TaxID=146919 RepID=UPI0021672AD1|nr:methyltransferase domain-containing protein [Salinibacter ruber]MCS3672811.1 2-polyprenyl-3-methyl-5-hydroxy-6-metoxy-1,4-benzoquinol methylase [Salinibacter ruber]
MALETIEGEDISGEKILDVGGGGGNFAEKLRERGASDITILDANPSPQSDLVKKKTCDLNEVWPVDTGKYDRIFALEVIEHLENPRFFFREIRRVLKEGSRTFVSTPNNESFFSRIHFLLFGQHRYFQDSCYPSHITPVLKKDIKRICNEEQLLIEKFYYSKHETIPKINMKVKSKIDCLSSNLGVLVKKTEV